MDRDEEKKNNPFEQDAHNETETEIDIRRAAAAKERAEKRLSGATPDIDGQRAEMALRRAMMRLKVAEHIQR